MTEALSVLSDTVLTMGSLFWFVLIIGMVWIVVKDNGNE